MAYLPGAYNSNTHIKIPNRIFVGGISFNTTGDELLEFFKRYGAVRDAKIICDEHGISKGYGFVTFYQEEVAVRLLSMGTIYFKAKKLNVGEAYKKIDEVPQQQQQYNAVVPRLPVAPVVYQPPPTQQTAMVYPSQNTFYYYTI